MVIFFFLVIILQKAVLKPLEELNDKTENLASGDGDLTKKLDIKTNDEIGHDRVLPKELPYWHNGRKK